MKQNTNIDHVGTPIQINRVLVTPTKTKLLPAKLELSNRVVRHFCGLDDTSACDSPVSTLMRPEDFLRVSFAEEDGSKLFGLNGSNELSPVYSKIQTIMENGEIQ